MRYDANQPPPPHVLQVCRPAGPLDCERREVMGSIPCVTHVGSSLAQWYEK